MTRVELESWLDGLRMVGSVVDFKIISYDETTGSVVARIDQPPVLKKITMNEKYRARINEMVKDVEDQLRR